MDATPARSLTGAARRSRRLQSTPAGHTGGATSATGSPYARPAFKRDSSSQTLAALESGGKANGSHSDAAKLDRRMSAGGTDGIFGRVKRGLGWLVGRTAESAASHTDSMDQLDEKPGDEESMLSGSTRPRAQGPPVATSRASSNLARNRTLPSSSYNANPSPSLLSRDGLFDDEESAAQKLRSSHSTLNLPRKTSPPKPSRVPHSSAGALGGRAISPQRPLSPHAGLLEGQGTASLRNKANIFAPGTSTMSSHNRLNGIAASSRRSVSPGGLSQFALASQPNSGASSAFGLQSQSPFRAGGHSARSPDLAALNVSSGLARSPSLPPDRLLSLQRQGGRLYPYQRSPSNLSGFARPNTIVPSYSVGSALSGLKRDHGAMSMSPPKPSPGPHAYFRTTSQGLHASPTGTDFSTEFSHRNKRQRVSVAWHPEEGFISTDAEGNPLRHDVPPVSVPKNEAERILERLENIRRPQIDGLRSSSPRRLNVPLPTSTPGKESIFATRISSSQTEPALSGYAISPYSRRQQAYREERALRRDKINARGGLSNHLRAAYSPRDSPPSQAMDDIAGGDDIEAESAHAEDASTVAEKDEEDSLPKPSTRRTRQRTRELSVMSDSSVQMDDTMTSLRRSTRIKNKPADDVTSPKRERKSAKSPPPTTGKRSKRKEPVSEATSDADMQAGRLSRAVSPRRARSPQKASAVGGRASSPAVEDQNMTIEQVISPAQPVEASAKEQSNQGRLSAREQRLQSTLGRRTRGFSAKDEADDIAPSSFGHTEQPKLKLPNSVFANRFSFGRSPSSSVLASPSSSTTNTGAVPTNGAKPLSAQASNEVEPVLPKFALPSSITPASLNVTFPHASEPGVNSHTLVKPTSAQSVASTPSFPAVATPDALQTAASTNKPLFSFTAPTKAPAEPSQTLPPKSHDQGIQASKPSPVSLIGSSQTISTTDEASNATTISAPFTFGQASNKRKPEENPPSFAFGKPVDSSSPPSIPVIDVTKPSNPFAAFPAATPSPSTTSGVDTSTTSTAKPTFSFGKTTSTPSAPTGTTDASDTASGSSVTSKAPLFKFGAVPSPTPAAVVPESTAKLSDTDGMQASPPPPSGANEKPANALFSPVIKPNTALSFSFGQPAPNISSSSASTAAQTPTFNFGSCSSTAPQGDTKSRSASPFSVGAPAQPFVFGKSDALKPATPALSFGATKPEVQAADKPTSSSGFTFGSGSATPAASAAPTAAFSFGGFKPASNNVFTTAPSMQASGSAFGASTPPVASSAQPTSVFGQNTTNGTAPTFAFGAQATGASGNSTTPTFNFGSSSTPATANPPAFAFGTANAATTSQPFVFGGGSATGGPTPPASIATGVPSFNFSAASAPGSQPASPAGTPSGLESGSLFTMGAGDTPTSPNKARRPIKGMRRPR